MPDDARTPDAPRRDPVAAATEPRRTPAGDTPRFAAAPPSSILLPGDPPARLRVLTPDDWRLEVALSRTPDVPRWTYYPPGLPDDAARLRVARSLDRARDGLAYRYVVVGADEEALGSVGTTIPEGVPEVFYALLPAGRGRGLATRAVVALADWALAGGHDEVRLYTLEGNEASEAVARRAGFVAADTVTTTARGGALETMTRWVRTAAAR
ncbi:GNAT family N-acetyltransferase [Luteimicrobium sp. NPDC057192]|uniref:GNAT family N-acetyltransferase n=1 Tax=Luteimicrobium sp. NPDC057192 TaxID=3346042 RepID=UPI003633C57D